MNQERSSVFIRL